MAEKFALFDLCSVLIISDRLLIYEMNSWSYIKLLFLLITLFDFEAVWRLLFFCPNALDEVFILWPNFLLLDLFDMGIFDESFFIEMFFFIFLFNEFIFIYYLIFF